MISLSTLALIALALGSLIVVAIGFIVVFAGGMSDSPREGKSTANKGCIGALVGLALFCFALGKLTGWI